MTYAINHEKLYAGMLIDGRLDDSFSLCNKQGEVIPFGKGLIKDAGGAKLPTSSSKAEDFVGVALYEHLRAYKDGEEIGAIPDYDMTVIAFGVVAVKVLEDVVEGDAVYWRVGATGTGDFCKTAGSDATLSVELPFKFMQSATSGSVAVIRIK